MQNPSAAFGIRGDEKDPQGNDIWRYFREELVDYSQDLLYVDRGPWPMPAPGRPLAEVAEVVNLPKEELKDWQKNVGRKYLKLLLTRFIPGLWWAYVKSRGRYRVYHDTAFNDLLNRRMYSKFFCDLDPGDKALFADILKPFGNELPELKKMDFSGMEKLCNHCHDGMYTAASVVLFSADGQYADGSVRYRTIGIHLYTVDQEGRKDESSARTYYPDSKAPNQKIKWQLAKYFALQGAVHRINMTEHGRLHFPLDAVNAITKSILPKQHPLFVLLLPHQRLTLAVDNSVLEGKHSLISRTNWTVYSPFTAAGQYIRKLIPDGYVGRRDKPNAFPPYQFPFQVKAMDTSFNRYLSAFLPLFEEFFSTALEQLMAREYRVDAHADEVDRSARRNWELVGLWCECIAEWVPGFLRREELNLKAVNGVVTPNIAPLTKAVANIVWNLTIAHAADHYEFGRNGPAGNIFRIHVKPPLGDEDVPANFHRSLARRRDLFQSYLAHKLFYSPLNLVLLTDVRYQFANIGIPAELQRKLEVLHGHFLTKLRQCEMEQLERDPDLCPLDAVSSSIQY